VKVEQGKVDLDTQHGLRIGDGGQVLLSQTTTLAREDLPDQVSLVGQGRRRLKDL
jgi:hypothetical protein